MGVKSTGSHPTTTKADGHLLEYFRQTLGAGGGGTNFVAPDSDSQQLVVSLVIILMEEQFIEHTLLLRQEVLM